MNIPANIGKRANPKGEASEFIGHAGGNGMGAEGNGSRPEPLQSLVGMRRGGFMEVETNQEEWLGTYGYDYLAACWLKGPCGPSR